MNIFLAGGTGAVGKRLVPMLRERGHRVYATTRQADRIQALRDAGAEPVVLDALDRQAVMSAVAAARPDVVIHQMTALSRLRNLKRFDEEFALTNRLRTEGTEHLLAASAAVGVRRFIAQSYAGWPSARSGSRVKSEEDALDTDPPRGAMRTLAAIKQLEAMVTGAHTVGIEGIVLRYGSLYGPGTSIFPGGDLVEAIRKRQLPIVGDGAGVWSFTHVDDAAAAARLAVDAGPSGIYNIVDDDPAEVSVWLPELARVIGAKKPFRVPAWIGRFAIGDVGVVVMTQIRGVSNAKAKRLLQWQPIHRSWREGFRAWSTASTKAA